MSIKVLDKEVVARIAAGEVVERPASVVKELVENALDAGATQIAVETRGGGISLIRVIDNGSGIPSDEVALAFERHATSKVKELADLDAISTLGFRGEALPSIAAVAQVEVATCAKDETAGTFITLERGVVTDQKGQGRSQGTTITARNLFREIPARLKFLKSMATESSHIANVVTQYALAYPEVKFTLLADGKVVVRTPGSGKLQDALTGIYGAETAQNMLAINGEGVQWGQGPAAETQVTGMVGAPSVSRASRDYLSFFVNRRWVNSRALTRAVEEAYSGLIMVGKHPIAVINIALPPTEVDVNTHPTKMEIKFRNEHAVFGAVQRAVRQSLIGNMPVPKIESPTAAYGTQAHAYANAYAVPPAAPGMPHRGMWSGGNFTQGAPTAEPMGASIPMLALPVLRLLGQFLNSYIVAEGSDGLYLIDQHAAHERILFEKVRQQQSEKKLEVQGLLEPATIEVTPKQESQLKQHEAELGESGFTVESFGERTWLVRSVPALLHGKDWRTALRELLDAETELERTRWQEKLAETIACHSAVRAGQLLSDDEMRALIRQLERCASPRTCPHGRPTVLQLSLGQLEREFGRT